MEQIVVKMVDHLGYVPKKPQGNRTICSKGGQKAPKMEGRGGSTAAGKAGGKAGRPGSDPLIKSILRPQKQPPTLDQKQSQTRT